MQKLLDQIESYLNHHKDMTYEVERDYDIGVDRINFSDSLMDYSTADVLIVEESRQILIRCFVGYIPEGKRLYVMSLLNHANSCLWESRASIDLKDGELLFSHLVNCRGIEITEDNFFDNLDMVLSRCEDATDKILKEIRAHNHNYVTDNDSFISWYPKDDN